MEQMEFCVDALRESLADLKADEQRISLVQSGMSKSIAIDMQRSSMFKSMLSHSGIEHAKSLKMENPFPA